jgi:DNA polymerase-3 subunit beta
MKVIAQTAALQEALNLAGAIVAARTPKPVLQCVKLTAENKMLRVQATDLEVGCTYTITAVEVQEEGAVLVPAGHLGPIVREAGDEESLALQTEKEACLIRCASSHFKVFGLDPGEFPAVTEFAEPGDFQVPAGQLTTMISRTLFAAAKAHSHYAISGVLWEASGRKLSLVATDGHRLAQAKGSLKKASAKDVLAIVPAKLMGLILRLTADAEEMLEVKVLENQILLRTARSVLVGSLVQGNFPKYSDVIPKECSRKATIAAASFEHTVRQAALLANEESRGVKLAFQSDRVTLTSRAPEAGEAEATCAVQLEGEPIEIGFNPNFLVEALRVAGAEEVTFEMNAPNKPAVLKAGSDFLYVLMPVDLG